MNKFSEFSAAGINALPRFGKKSKYFFSELSIPKLSKIGIYIHIPFCRTICKFCMLRKGAKATNTIPDEFIQVLIKEFGFYSDVLRNTIITTIYFGGGTPSMLKPKQIEKILEALYSGFPISENLEITFEGEPTSLNDIYLLKCLKENNVRRLSFGLQTFNIEMRDLLGRTDTIETIFELKKKLDKIQFHDINVDYIYNLPDTDISYIKKDLKMMSILNPTSIDCHPLKYISCSNVMLSEIVKKKMAIPDSEQRINFFNLLKEWCFDQGYFEQFTDQYSKHGKEGNNIYMRHLYGLDGGQYIGFGPGARSHYSDNGFSNYQNLEDYTASILNEQKPISKQIYAPHANNFITCFPKRNDSLQLVEIQNSTQREYFLYQINKLIELGYINNNDDTEFVLTSNGQNWYQNIQEELLSKTQRECHEETLKERIQKLGKFNGYFKNIGTFL